MGFNIYWIVTVSLELLCALKSSARVTKPLILNTTEGCLSGNQSLAKCGIHAATRNRMKILRKQMYSTPVGFTYPNVPNSYEVDMGYSPNVGFEPYWPGTTIRGTTRRDYKVCGVICPSMYINYGPVCAINKNNEYKSFISYCDMRNEDCVGSMRWRAIYKGECSAFVRTFPTKSSDIRKRISSYITEYFNRTPTTAAPGVASYDNMRKYGPLTLEYYDINLDNKSRNDGAQGSKRGQINKNIVRDKHIRHAPYRGELHGNIRNHNGTGRKGRGQKGTGQKDRGRNGHSQKGLVGVSSHQQDIAGNLQAHINNNRIDEPSRKIPGRKGARRNVQKRKELQRRGPHRGNLFENPRAHNVRSQGAFSRKNLSQNDDGKNRREFRGQGRHKRNIVGHAENNNLKNLKDPNREIIDQNTSGRNYQSRKERSRKSLYQRNKDSNQNRK